jgi:uncharacterized hydrophobic protein (TIGR00341 family)
MGSGHTGRALDRISDQILGTESARVLVLPLDATLPRPRAGPSGDEHPEARSAAAVSREEVYAQVSDQSALNVNYASMVVLSTTVAAVGLAKDNAPAVIGAMVVAPLLGPNMGLALALTLGDRGLLRTAFRSSLVGVALAFATSVAFGAALPLDPLAAEIVSRTRVDLFDILLALAAGCAGTLAYTSGAPAYLIGVMVAVALLPPTVACGLLVSAGHQQGAIGAGILVLCNVAAVNLAAIGTFAWKGMRPRHWWSAERARRTRRWGLAVWLLLLAALAALISLSEELRTGALPMP